MAKKIGGPQIRRTSNQTTKRLQDQKNEAHNRELALKKDVGVAKAAQAGNARQGLKTDKDKEISKGPQEKVTLSHAETLEKGATSGDEVALDAPQQNPVADNVDSVRSEAPKAKTSVDFESDFLSTLTQSVDQDAMASIGQKTNESLQQLSMGGAQEVNQGPVLASHSYIHARDFLSAKMPNASLKEIRAAAKSDPEIAKYVKLLDSSKAYINSVKKEVGQAQANKAGDASASAEGPNVASGGGGGAVPPSGGGPADGPMAADPFASARGPASSEGSQTRGPGGEEQPFYHKSPEEQAELIRERNSQMNEIMKIYNQMMQDNRKAMAERHALVQQTNQEIYDIFLSIHARRAQSMAKHNDMYMRIITESWE